jgi:hypothetical protein
MKLVVGFSRPRSGFVPFAKAIMWFEGTDYSHVYLKFKSDSLNRTIIYQASSTMVNFMGSNVFDGHAQIVAEYEIEIPEDSRVALMQMLIDRAGMPYGIKEVIGIFFYKTLGWKIFQDGEKSFVCSELVARILYGLAIPGNFSHLDFVTPKDIRSFVDSDVRFLKIA